MSETTLWKPTHPVGYAYGNYYSTPVAAMYNSNGVSGLIKYVATGDIDFDACPSKCGGVTFPSNRDDLTEAYTVLNPIWAIRAWAREDCYPLLAKTIAAKHSETHPALKRWANKEVAWAELVLELMDRGGSGIMKTQRAFYFAVEDTERHPMLRPLSLVVICQEASLEVAEGRLRFNPETCLTLAAKLGERLDKEAARD